MLKLGSLGQKIGQLLAVLHDNGRLFPHRRRVSPAMAIPKGKNVKETPGVAGRNDRSPRAGILNGHAVPTIRLDLTE
jgi:hypothetical protein